MEAATYSRSSRSYPQQAGVDEAGIAGIQQKQGVRERKNETESENEIYLLAKRNTKGFFIEIGDDEVD